MYGKRTNYYTFTKEEYERIGCGKISAKRGVKPVDCKNYRATTHNSSNPKAYTNTNTTKSNYQQNKLTLEKYILFLIYG